MDTTIILLQFLGVFFASTGLIMALRRKMMMSVFHDIFSYRGMSFILGLILMFLGLFLVFTHNRWGSFNEIIVSVLGWYILLESLLYLVLPQKKFKKMEKILHKKYFYHFITLVYFAVGVLFIIQGFFLN